MIIIIFDQFLQTYIYGLTILAISMGLTGKTFNRMKEIISNSIKNNHNPADDFKILHACKKY